MWWLNYCLRRLLVPSAAKLLQADGALPLSVVPVRPSHRRPDSGSAQDGCSGSARRSARGKLALCVQKARPGAVRIAAAPACLRCISLFASFLGLAVARRLSPLATDPAAAHAEPLFRNYSPRHLVSALARSREWVEEEKGDTAQYQEEDYVEGIGSEGTEGEMNSADEEKEDPSPIIPVFHKAPTHGPGAAARVASRPRHGSPAPWKARLRHESIEHQFLGLGGHWGRIGHYS